MGMEVSNKDYRKVVFDTDNPFLSMKFRAFIGENKLPVCDGIIKGSYGKYVLFLTEKQLASTEKAFFGMLGYCKQKNTLFNERVAFLSKYFDSVFVFNDTSVGLECRMKSGIAEPVHLVLYCGKDDNMPWEYILKKVKAQADIDVYSWYYRLRDIYLMEIPPMTNEQLMEMAEAIHKRLMDCVSAIENKLEEAIL